MQWLLVQAEENYLSPFPSAVHALPVKQPQKHLVWPDELWLKFCMPDKGLGLGFVGCTEMDETEVELHAEGPTQTGGSWRRKYLCFAGVPFESSFCSMIPVPLSSWMREVFCLCHLNLCFVTQNQKLGCTALAEGAKWCSILQRRADRRNPEILLGTMCVCLAAGSISSCPKPGLTPVGGWRWGRSLPAWRKLSEKCRWRWEVCTASDVVGKRTESSPILQTPNNTAGRKFIACTQWVG